MRSTSDRLDSTQPKFSGFPANAEATAIPKVFFTDLLPQLADDVVALGITLYAFKALQSKRGSPRYITLDELLADSAVAAFLAGAGVEMAKVLNELQRAVDLGILLPLTVEREGERHELYFLNAPADRRGMEAVRSGSVDLGRIVQAPRAQSAERSTIFSLYEALIGSISPLIADELTEAERLYPAEWLDAAFREAAAQNARSWRYVSRILERWTIEGPNYATTERDSAGDGRYFDGKYGRILKRRLDA